MSEPMFTVRPDRYVLQFKKIPYQTQWIEYPDIAKVCKENNIPPTSYEKDGSPYYTFPAIIDEKTGVAIAESALIAAYLDKTYPDTPKAFPNDSAGLQFAFSKAHGLMFMPGWPLIVPAVAKILNPYSSEYFIRTRTEWFGKPLNELIKSEEERLETLTKFKTFWDGMDEWYSKTEGPFLMGSVVSYGDFIIASDVHFLRAAWGEESDNWMVFKSWHEGKWVTLAGELDKLCNLSSR